MSDLKSSVQGRWASTAGIELSGSPSDLRRLASQLTDATEELIIVLAELDNEMIMPYEGAISHLVVHSDPGEKLRITRIGNVMELRGDTSNLSLFAQNVAFFDDQPLSPLDHLHIEFYPDHFFLAPCSEPLIISPFPIRHHQQTTTE